MAIAAISLMGDSNDESSLIWVRHKKVVDKYDYNYSPFSKWDSWFYHTRVSSGSY